MPTYARPGDVIRAIGGGYRYLIISPTSHQQIGSPYTLKPMVPWDRYDLDGVYELMEESVVDRILTKYSNGKV